jgi:predicted PurR-regulated permease PerM
MDELARPSGADVRMAAPDGEPALDSTLDGGRGTGPAGSPHLWPPPPRVGLVVAAAAIVAVLLYLGREALTPFIVGLLIVYLLDPPVERLSRVRFRRLRIPRWFAILVVYGAAILVVAEILNLTLQPLVGQLADFIKNLPALAKSLDALLRQVSEFYNGLRLPPQVRDLIDQAIADVQSGAGGLDPMAILLPVFRSVASVVTTIFAFFVVPFWAFYILKDRPSMTRGFDAALPAEWRPDVRAIAWIANTVFGRWVRGQVLLGLVVGLATFAGLIALDILVDPIFGRFAVFFAVLAGLLELLPIIGPIISAVPPTLIALTVSPTAVVATLLLYFGVQQVENTVLVPKIQGDAVQLHPSIVVFALIVGGAIAGLLGAILALPVTAAGRDVFRYLFRRLGPEPRPSALEAAAGVLGSSIHPAPGETREEAAQEAIEGTTHHRAADDVTDGRVTDGRRSAGGGAAGSLTADGGTGPSRTGTDARSVPVTNLDDGPDG